MRFHHTLLLLGLAAPPLWLASCGSSEESAPALQCGPGTREVDGRCVGTSCGPGTHDQGGVCVPDGASGAGGSPEGGTGGTAGVAGSGGSGGASGGAGSGTGGTGGDAGSGGAGGLPNPGDPCPKDAQGNDVLGWKCSGNLLYRCLGAHVMVVDCAALGGECKPDPNIPSYGRCDGGPFVACDGSKDYQHCISDEHILTCEDDWWTATACSQIDDSQDMVCMKAPLSESSYCVPEGTQTCDPATFPAACSSDGKAIVRCVEGLVAVSPCAKGGKDHCVAGPTEPVCVMQGAVPCEPSTHHGACIGSGSLEVCASASHYTDIRYCQGTETCLVSALGWAACVPPGTEQCDPSTAKTHCADKTSMHVCKYHGFEELVDCTKADPSWFCLESSDSASCGAAQSCDPSTYQANCSGPIAANCHPFGYLVEEDCSLTSYPPQCFVENGKAVCK